MAKRLVGFIFCCLLVIFTSACGKNNNIFSRAHRSDNDSSYDSLMSDADSEMRNQSYGDAAKHYCAATNLRPGDKKAVMKCTSAVMCNTLGCDTLGDSTITTIALKMINNDTTTIPMLDFTALSHEKIYRISEELSNFVNNENMFPALFEVENPPTDTSTNFNGSIVYVLESIFSAAKSPEIKQAQIYVDGTFDFNKLPPKSSDSPAIESVVRNMRDKVLKAMKCLNKIENKNPTAEQFKLKLERIIRHLDLWLTNK
jgi:hypothetical protein